MKKILFLLFYCGFAFGSEVELYSNGVEMRGISAWGISNGTPVYLAWETQVDPDNIPEQCGNFDPGEADLFCRIGYSCTYRSLFWSWLDDRVIATCSDGNQIWCPVDPDIPHDPDLFPVVRQELDLEFDMYPAVPIDGVLCKGPVVVERVFVNGYEF